MLRIDGDEREGGFVQVDADEGAELIEWSERVVGMFVGSCEFVFSFLSHEKDLQIKN